MKIKYRKLPDILDPTKYSRYPYLQVTIRYQQNAGQPLLALVDSGAIDTLFPASLADTLGIDVLSGERKPYFGIGGNLAIGYIHECDMQVSGFKTWVKMRLILPPSKRSHSARLRTEFVSRSRRLALARLSSRLQIGSIMLNTIGKARFGLQHSGGGPRGIG